MKSTMDHISRTWWGSLPIKKATELRSKYYPDEFIIGSDQIEHIYLSENKEVEPVKDSVVSSVDTKIKEQSEMYASLHESKLQDNKDWLKVRVHYYSGAMWHKETVQSIIESHAELLQWLKNAYATMKMMRKPDEYKSANIEAVIEKASKLINQ